MTPNPYRRVSMISCGSSNIQSRAGGVHSIYFDIIANCSLTFLDLSFKLALKLNTLIVHSLKIFINNSFKEPVTNSSPWKDVFLRPSLYSQYDKVLLV